MIRFTKRLLGKVSYLLYYSVDWQNFKNASYLEICEKRSSWATADGDAEHMEAQSFNMLKQIPAYFLKT